MKSALFTADWQFHNLTDKGVPQSKVCFRERRLLRLPWRLVVWNLLCDPETTGMGLRHILKAGGEARATWMRQKGQVCFIQWPLLGGHTQVDTHVFTRECLHPRMADASTSGVTPYFMLCTQLDTAVHVLADCTWLRQPTKSWPRSGFRKVSDRPFTAPDYSDWFPMAQPRLSFTHGKTHGFQSLAQQQILILAKKLRKTYNSRHTMLFLCSSDTLSVL